MAVEAVPVMPLIWQHVICWGTSSTLRHCKHITAALHCHVLHCTVLHFTAVHCTAVYCSAVHCTELHYNTLPLFGEKKV